MSKSSKRMRRVADLIKREVAFLMKASMNDPRLVGIMITTVDVSPDLSNAKIYFTLTDPSMAKEASAALEKARGFVRHSLAGRTEMRYTPQLYFVYDDSISYAGDLLNLIDSVQPDMDSDDA